MLIYLDMQDIAKEKLDTIIDLGEMPSFMSEGIHDEEGNQIFTPEFVCNDMFNMIGMENILDINKTILEPASGDGAFTVRILELRLNSIKDDPDYFQKSLVALSTIFSIEMDEDLINKQRNNIYTVLMIHAGEKGNIPEGYEQIAKEIILTNFIWGETNIDTPVKYIDDSIGWYMPTTKKNKTRKNRIVFAKWSIGTDIQKSEYKYEGWDSEQTVEDYSSLGGLFDYAE